jgi:hypothetical protein
MCILTYHTFADDVVSTHVRGGSYERDRIYVRMHISRSPEVLRQFYVNVGKMFTISKELFTISGL